MRTSRIPPSPRRRVGLGTVALYSVTALVATACAAGGGDDGAGDQGGKPRYGGTLRVVHPADVSSLDPIKGNSGNDHSVLFSIYDRLVDFDPKTMAPRPGLAESWEYPSPKVFVLHLRKGVKFQDDTPFNANAVKFNLDRAINAKYSSVATDLASIKSIQTPDKYTVKITLKNRDTALPLALSDRAGMMVSPAPARKYGADFEKHPIGAGPFKVTKSVFGDYVEAKKFQHYWRKGQPYLDGIKWTILEEPQTRTSALLSGQQDFVSYVEVPDVPKVKTASDIQLKISDSLALYRCKLRKDKGPLKDVRVRKAVEYGINRQAISQATTRGMGKPVDVLLPPSHWAYPKDVAGTYKYNPAAAKKLLADAGYASGVTLEAVVTTEPVFRTIGEAMQAQLKDVGIDLRVTVMDHAESTPAYVEHGKFDVNCVGWSGRPDPYQTFAANYSPNSAYDAPYEAPPGLMDAMAGTIADESTDARSKAVSRFSQIAMKQYALILPLTTEPSIQAYSDKVHGYVPNLYGKPILNGIWLTK